MSRCLHTACWKAAAKCSQPGRGSDVLEASGGGEGGVRVGWGWVRVR